MGNAMPDPKTLVDSLADGALELAEGPARVAKNVADVCSTFASEVQGNMEAVKGQLPDNPEVLPDVAVKALGQTVSAGIGIFEGIGKGIMDTVAGVKNQIRRVTG